MNIPEIIALGTAIASVLGAIPAVVMAFRSNGKANAAQAAIKAHQEAGH